MKNYKVGEYLFCLEGMLDETALRNHILIFALLKVRQKVFWESSWNSYQTRQFNVSGVKPIKVSEN